MAMLLQFTWSPVLRSRGHRLLPVIGSTSGVPCGFEGCKSPSAPPRTPCTNFTARYRTTIYIDTKLPWAYEIRRNLSIYWHGGKPNQTGRGPTLVERELIRGSRLRDQSLASRRAAFATEEGTTTNPTRTGSLLRLPRPNYSSVG